MESLQVSEILSRTDGALYYVEQFYEIGLKVLKLEKEQVDKMYQAYSRKTKEVEGFNQLILEKIKEKDLAESLIFMFKIQVPLLQYELIINLQEENYKLLLKNILASSNDKLKYYYQAHMILTDIGGFTDYQAQAIISNYKNQQLIAGEKEYLFKKMFHQPSIASQIHELLANAHPLDYSVPIK